MTPPVVVLPHLIPVTLADLKATLRSEYGELVRQWQENECDVCSLIRMRNQIIRITPAILVTAQVIQIGGGFYIDPDRYVLFSRQHLKRIDPETPPWDWQSCITYMLRWLRQERGFVPDNSVENHSEAGGLTELHHWHRHLIGNRGDGREANTSWQNEGPASVRYQALVDQASAAR